ncbi:MAG: helix-turn-helix domain-containing protein [Bacteroidales bacterium]
MAPGRLTQYPALATTAGGLRANLATEQNDLEGELGRRADPPRVLPMLLTVDEAADILRSSRRAIYAMVERRQLPGVIRIRRRVLLRSDDLLHWLNQKRASSPEE